MPDVELAVPARSAYVAVVRLALAALARSAGMEEEAVDDLKIAVSEACTNAVLAHEDAQSDEPVSVTWAEEPDRVIVEVADRGAVYDPDQPDADTQGFATRTALSIALLKSLADDFEMGPREGGGMCARLIINL